jgi:hypothetical protein
MDLHVERTRNGYLAVLRTQRGQEVGRGYCSDDEARGVLEERIRVGELPAEIGFSFGNFARMIGRVAGRIAKSKALKSIMSVAAMLPPPISTVAKSADAALRAIDGIRRGNPRALAAWRRAAELAREEPNSTAAVAMRLAMKAAGRPVAPRTAKPAPSSPSSPEL